MSTIYKTKTEVIKIRSKNIDKNEMVEYKKRVEKRKKEIEEKAKTEEITKDKVVKNVTKDKVVKNVTKEKIAKNKTTKEMSKNKTTGEVVGDKKKRIIKKKPSKECIDKIKRRAEERAYRIVEGTEEEFPEHREEPKHEITKGERTERFKKLHELAIQMTKQWKENK